MIKRILAAFVAFLLIAGLAMTGIITGTIPLLGNKELKALTGWESDSLVLVTSGGWEDYSGYFRFDRWVQSAVKQERLQITGDTTQPRCFGPSFWLRPWWFNMGKEVRGLCWTREFNYGGGIFMFYVPDNLTVTMHYYTT